MAADSPGMETIEQLKTAETIKMGPDRVMISGDRVVIDAKHPMTEWQVREFAPMPIYFRDKKYLLRQKIVAEKPYAVRYILGPWPEGTTQGNRTFNYDEEAIAQRDGELRSGHVDDVGRAAPPIASAASPTNDPSPSAKSSRPSSTISASI